MYFMSINRITAIKKTELNSYIFKIQANDEPENDKSEIEMQKQYVQIKCTEFMIKNEKRTMLQLIDISADILNEKYKAISKF